MNILKQVESAINTLPNVSNTRFVEADYSMGIYSDGYQADIRMDSVELFQFLGALMQELEYQISVEVYPLGKEELRVFIALH